MIQIAFCDDDQTVLDQLSALLEKYRAQNKITVRIRSTLNTQNTPRLPQQETEGYLLCFICVICVGSSPYAITCGDS